MKTLIVEDDPDLALLLSLSLARQGYECAVASTLAHGRSLLEAEAFAYLILDLVLPDGFGTEILPLVAASKSKDAVVIVSSGNVSDAVRSDGRIDHIFAKPYVIDDLVSCMGRR
jgi:two-component system cell cycle response regulator CtrA